MFSLLVIATLACTLLAGGIPALWTLLPSVLHDRLHLDEDEVRGWRRWVQLSLIFALPLVGQLVDRWGGQTILFTGILGVATAIAWLGLAQDRRAALLSMLLLGVSYAAVVVPTLVMLPRTIALDNLGKTIAAMNIGFAGVTLGTLITPGLTRWLLARLGYRNSFLIMALACLIPAAIVALVAQDLIPAPVGIQSIDVLSRDARWWLVLCLGLFYFPLEHLLDLWREPNFLQAEPHSRLTRPGYWITLLLMRLAIGWLMWDNYEAWGLVCLAAAFAIVVGNLASARAPNQSPWGIWLVAASFAPLLPTLLAIVMNLFHTNATMLGMILALGAFSGLTMRPMLERFAERNSVPMTMRLSMILALAWATLALVLALLGYTSVSA